MGETSPRVDRIRPTTFVAHELRKEAAALFNGEPVGFRAELVGGYNHPLVRRVAMRFGGVVVTEKEWLNADLAARYSLLCPRWYGDERRHQPRKGSLLWVAWAREVYQRLPWVYRLFVDYAERAADDTALYATDVPYSLSAGIEGIGYCETSSAKEAAVRELEARLWDDFELRPRGDEPPYAPTDEVLGAVSQALLGTFLERPPHSSRLPDSQQFAAFFRDIFGNPFRSADIDSRWQSETVVSLASAIYADHAFDRMPILADALEEAGCDDADVLNHCRGDGPHVRGCWVVDLLLGKE